MSAYYSSEYKFVNFFSKALFPTCRSSESFEGITKVYLTAFPKIKTLH